MIDQLDAHIAIEQRVILARHECSRCYQIDSAGLINGLCLECNKLEFEASLDTKHY